MKIKNQNILSADEKYIGHLLDISKTDFDSTTRIIFNEYPLAYNAYLYSLKQDIVQLWGVHCTKVSNDRTIVTIMCDFKPYIESCYSVIEAAFMTLNDMLAGNRASLALPYDIGNHIEGGDSKVIHTIINDNMTNVNVALYNPYK